VILSTHGCVTRNTAYFGIRITAFLESVDFEDAIRNAISIGGDSDTIAAITGSIAEAAYGIPDWIKDKAYSFLDEPLKDVLRRWKKFVPHQFPG